MDLSIIIPAHNEAATIGGSLFGKSARFLRERYPNCELIIVDDGSSDATAESAADIGDKVIQQIHSGKGAALCRGMQVATGKTIIWADADWSVPVDEVPRLVTKVQTTADYVMGSRGWARPGSPFGRRMGSSLYTIACRIAFDWEFTDTQCGMKALSRKTADLFLERLRFFGPNVQQDFPSTDALFDVECLLVARQSGLRVATVPVRWQHYDNRSVMRHLPLLKRIGWDFLKVRQAYLSGLYSSGS